MKSKLFVLIACMAVLCVSQAGATTITYNVNITGSIRGSIVGTLTTDGTIGALAPTNILSWDLNINNGLGETGVLVGPFTPPPPLSGNQSFINNDEPGVLVGSLTNLEFLFTDNDPLGLFSISGISQGIGLDDMGDVTPSGEVFIFAEGVVGDICCAAPSDVIGTVASVAPTPLPAALPLFGAGLGLVGLLARRRKQKTAAVAA
jgi:hypothetical protein